MFNDINIQKIIIILGSLLISVSFHEAMHGFTAHWLGDTTAKDAGRLTLNPLKHINSITTILLPLILIIAGYPPFFAAQPVPFNPARLKFDEFGAALVGIAGPLTNLALACIAAIVYRLFLPHLTELEFNIVSYFGYINVGLFVFNMIPIPPLDGSRLVYAFAPEPLQELMQRIESTGFLVILANINTSIVNFLFGG
jgi:Zn-dependent protease